MFDPPSVLCGKARFNLNTFMGVMAKAPVSSKYRNIQVAQITQRYDAPDLFIKHFMSA